MNFLRNISAKSLIALIGLLYLVLATVRDLSIPDEGRYADISRWMFEHQDFLTPRINGLPFIHKPPLLHWLTSELLSVFGLHNIVYRLVPIFASLILLSTIYWFVNRHGQYLINQSIRATPPTDSQSPAPLSSTQANDELAKIAVVVLAFSLIFIGSAQYVNHDMLVACMISVTAFCFADYVMKPRLAVLMLGYAACALGFLSKGLIGILIPGMIILPWVLWTKNWRKIPSLLNPLGIALLLLIVSPWLWLMSQKYPHFLNYFFIEQQFDRFSSSGFNNHQPWFFYAGCLVISFFPFLMLLQFGQKGWAARILAQLKTNPILAFLVWWFVSCLVFFSIPASKLIGYILPTVAPLTILIASNLLPTLQPDFVGEKKWQRYVMPIFILLFAIALLVTGYTHVLKPEKVFAIHLLRMFGVIITLVALGLWVLAIRRRASAFIINTLASITLFIGVLFAIQGIDTKKNADAKYLERVDTANTVIVFYRSYYYDVPMFLNSKNSLYVVYDWNNVKSDNVFMELKDGLRFEPQLKRYLISVTDLSNLMTSSPNVLVIVPTRTKLPPQIASSLQKTDSYNNFDVWRKVTSTQPSEPSSSIQ